MGSFEEMDDEEYRARRVKRMAEMRREKEKQRQQREMIKKALPFAAGAVSLLIIGSVAISLAGGAGKGKGDNEEPMTQVQGDVAGVDDTLTAKPEENGDDAQTKESTETADTGTVYGGLAGYAGGGLRREMMEGEQGIVYTRNALSEAAHNVYAAEVTEETDSFGGSIVSSNAVLVDVEQNSIVAKKREQEVISPASMTKILTVLVAAEHVTNLDDTFTITIDITDYSYVNDCSNVGFAKDETVTVRDLFYGTILPSGADAAVGLATYVAGSQEEFVKLMNDKLEELGISETAHFTNCVGLYDPEHHCTVYDMAVILEAAMDNELCREVLSAHTYTTSPTTEHPEGITISNWFLRRIEDKDSGDGFVVGGKTGYVVESGNCAASYATGSDGKAYVCVTVNAENGWKCIEDHAAIYKKYIKS